MSLRATLVIAPVAALVAGLVVTAMAAPARADGEPFSQARFEALQAEGALILVDVAADWCPTCAKQNVVIDRYRKANPEVPLHVLRVDFDAQKEWVIHFKAPRQSTLLLFKGKEQVWFAVAETRQEVIDAAIDAAAASG